MMLDSVVVPAVQQADYIRAVLPECSFNDVYLYFCDSLKSLSFERGDFKKPVTGAI